MKTSLCFLVFVLIFNTSIFSDENKNIAVLDFEAKGVEPREASIITDIVRGFIVKTNKFTVLDRANIDAILKEQAFQHSGQTETEKIIEIGKLLNVHFVIVGTLSRLGSMYILSTEMIDVKTSKIIKSEVGKSKSIEDMLDIAQNISMVLVGETTSSTIIKADSPYVMYKGEIPVEEYIFKKAPENWKKINHRKNGSSVKIAPGWAKKRKNRSKEAIMEFEKNNNEQYTIAVTYISSERQASHEELKLVIKELSRGEDLLARKIFEKPLDGRNFVSVITVFEGYSQSTQIKSAVRVLSTNNKVFIIIGAVPYNATSQDWNELLTIISNYQV
jgi:TolB-like protein